MTDPYVALAGGVVNAALQDIRKPDNLLCAVDAADFLLRRLWDEDSLWLDLIGQALVPREVRRRVMAVMHPLVRERLSLRLRRLAG